MYKPMYQWISSVFTNLFVICVPILKIVSVSVILVHTVEVVPFLSVIDLFHLTPEIGLIFTL